MVRRLIEQEQVRAGVLPAVRARGATSRRRRTARPAHRPSRPGNRSRRDNRASPVHACAARAGTDAAAAIRRAATARTDAARSSRWRALAFVREPRAAQARQRGVEERRLAGAIGAEQADARTGTQSELDVVQHGTPGITGVKRSSTSSGSGERTARRSGNRTARRHAPR